MDLIFAHLTYGSQLINVPHTDINPIPLQFNFDDVDECAKHIFAIMSNASGGFTLRNCVVRVDQVRKVANLTSSGCHVFYAPTDRPKMTIQEAEQVYDRCITRTLGSVSTDQYGSGYKRAVWTTE